MNWRSEWTPRPVSSAKLRDIEQAIGEIERLLEKGDEAAAADKVRLLNQTCGRNESVWLFRDYRESGSITELALRLSQPAPVRVGNVKREEWVELVRRIQDPEYSEAVSRDSLPLPDSGQAKLSDGDRFAFLQDFYLDVLTANVSMPGLSDLIFWDDLEPEEIADRIQAYRPIQLPPG
ncbi:hypothetical protein [Saccharibacillus sacchari]|uniref:Uncharacterized protein n=1 Tax=Saccharibacillus sacchari TaxID=456493 RepID=A0ACC6P7Y4_9BACL